MTPPGASNLIRLNPADGSLLSFVLITDGLVPINIADLAFQPGTGALYGIRGPNDGLDGQGELYTINPGTGAATLVGNTGDFFGSIAFAPDGTLYMSAADLDPVTDNLINIALQRLNPANAAVLSSVPTSEFYGALGIRPTDGVIFGGDGDQSHLFTINPITGAATLVGNTGRNFVGDLAFQADQADQPVPEPATIGLLSLGLVGVVRAHVRSRRTKR